MQTSAGTGIACARAQRCVRAAADWRRALMSEESSSTRRRTYWSKETETMPMRLCMVLRSRARRPTAETLRMLTHLGGRFFFRHALSRSVVRLEKARWRPFN